MYFRVFALLFSASFLFIQCASQKNNSSAWQKSIEESYYNIWSTGAAPAGTGANFFVKLNKTDLITVESFIVNGEELEFELKQTESATLIIGRKYTGPNFEKENQEMPTFYKQKEFTGTITFSNFDQQVDILISSFERRELEQKYM
jgi:hypothetical protein